MLERHQLKMPLVDLCWTGYVSVSVDAGMMSSSALSLSKNRMFFVLSHIIANFNRCSLVLHSSGKNSPLIALGVTNYSQISDEIYGFVLCIAQNRNRNTQRVVDISYPHRIYKDTAPFFVQFQYKYSTLVLYCMYRFFMS